MRTVKVERLTKAEFAPFGDVIEKEGVENFKINDGRCTRYHDLAHVEIAGPQPRALVNIFESTPVSFPYELRMVERHPFGSQAFVPLSDRPFLVIVCEDEGAVPVRPRAFVTAPGQGINFFRNTWHGVLTPLEAVSDFVVVDRGGEGNNLEEYFFDEPYCVVEG
ncbi:ureidoglycolate lyase [Stappia sp. GBMRC 2046]|uniref:Ureidoglycolate lyase n=1 Tax=Stappia sediminis TaxID=2692190 RepID=A0A7X3LYK1_9HYPH|nr:ureidoglycolate lyase [Stappia sediminis]MXN67463.1 ureidoglycolate lyase [Stappia sediminis]